MAPSFTIDNRAAAMAIATRSSSHHHLLVFLVPAVGGRGARGGFYLHFCAHNLKIRRASSETNHPNRGQ